MPALPNAYMYMYACTIETNATEPMHRRMLFFHEETQKKYSFPKIEKINGTVSGSWGMCICAKSTAFIPVCTQGAGVLCVHRRDCQWAIEHVTDICDVVVVIVILLPCLAFYLFVVFSTISWRYIGCYLNGKIAEPNGNNENKMKNEKWKTKNEGRRTKDIWQWCSLWRCCVTTLTN